jgi:hypothetical protein
MAIDPRYIIPPGMLGNTSFAHVGDGAWAKPDQPPMLKVIEGAEDGRIATEPKYPTLRDLEIEGKASSERIRRGTEDVALEWMSQSKRLYLLRTVYHLRGDGFKASARRMGIDHTTAKNLVHMWEPRECLGGKNYAEIFVKRGQREQETARIRGEGYVRDGWQTAWKKCRREYEGWNGRSEPAGTKTTVNLVQEHAKLISEIAARDEKIKAEGNRVNLLNSDIEDLTHQLTTAQAKISAAEKKLAAAEAKIKELEAELAGREPSVIPSIYNRLPEAIRYLRLIKTSEGKEQKREIEHVFRNMLNRNADHFLILAESYLLPTGEPPNFEGKRSGDRPLWFDDKRVVYLSDENEIKQSKTSIRK